MTNDAERLIGQVGFVTTRIAGRERPGEVQVSLGDGSEAFIAYGDDAIERGARVLVIGRRPGRALEVTAYSD